MVLAIDFMTLNILKLDINFYIFPKFIVNLRHHHKHLLEHSFNVILSRFKQLLDNHVFKISTCTPLALFSKICRLSLIFFININ